MGRTIITDDGKFEWDEDKNAQNREKHGIDFNFAKRVFDDEEKIEEYDALHSTYNEERYRVVGMVDNNILFVVETEMDSGRIRIISARYADKIYQDKYFLMRG
ncbi:MAG: BrnT family toxin [Spirochaetaceae bacterium]|jgi:uncharacterized DUF497 family protein|nr:BrnT family toxin [Spirochaetaceae bacterium]